MWNSVKCISQVQVDYVTCSSLIHQCYNLVIDGLQICQAKFALSEAMLAITNHLPVPPFQKDMLHDLARH